MNKTQIGIFNLPNNMAFPNDKVLKLFTKLKRKAKEMETKSPSIPQSPAGPLARVHQYEIWNQTCRNCRFLRWIRIDYDHT